MWTTTKAMGLHPVPDSEAARLSATGENTYWEAVYWQDRGVLETDRTARAVELGKAATDFSEVIAWSGEIQSLCSNGTCS